MLLAILLDIALFEFQSNRNNPEKLLEILEQFTKWWFFPPHNEELGVSPERLSLVSLPTPLRTLYSFAGEWPGGTYETIFSHQNHLLPFECLEVRDGKLVFAFENQGTWLVGTETEGDDPPVYLSDDGQPFKLLCDSLAQFLVTFCLYEALYGAVCLSGVDDINELNSEHGKLPIPLWLDGPYVSITDKPRHVSFFLVDGCILQTEGWCGGRVDGLDKKYPDFFPNNKSHRPPEPTVRRYLWEIPEVPKIIKAQHLEMMIDRHEAHAQSHRDKATFYRDALKNLDAES